MTQPAAATESKPASVWEDFIDIFVSPSEVFARRERSSFVVPLLVLTIVMAVLYVGTKPLLQPIFDAEWSRQIAAAMQKNPKLTPESMAGMRKFSDTFGVVFVVVGIPVQVLLTGLVLWLVGKLLESKQTVGAAMVVASFAFFPRIIQQIVSALQAAVMDPTSLTSVSSVSISAARLLDPDTTSGLLLALAARVDLFTIWVTILLAIGLYVTGKVSKGQAGIAAAIVWLLGALPSVLRALRAG